MLYLFVLGVPLQVLAGIITMSRGMLYAGYGAGLRGFGLTAMADQQAGGLILWVPGGFVLWIAITVLWVRWARNGERAEREASGDDAAPPLTIPG
jgi:cytochrome c oxidase assembly factor CtaG